MKNLILSCLTLLLVNVIIAQDVSFVSNTDAQNSQSEIKSEKTTTAKVSEAEVTFLHSKSAKQQLSAHLKQSITYTKKMRDYCVEGKIEIEVSMNEKGEVASYKIAGNPHPEISRAVKKAMKNIKAISIKNNDYRGMKEVPISLLFEMN